MKHKSTTQTERKVVPLISVLLGAAVLATTTAYLIFRFFSEKTYRKKWEDYDDCGLA